MYTKENLKAKTKDELVEIIIGLNNSNIEAELDELKATVLEQEGIIAELNTANAKINPLSNVSNPVVVVDGKRYEVRIPRFIFKSKEYKAADVTAEVAKQLIDKKSNAIKAL